MKIYEDTDASNGPNRVAHLGYDVKSQEYVYLYAKYNRYYNELNINNIAFVPVFSFKEEIVQASFFKPVTDERFYDVNVIPRFIFNQCTRDEKLMNTREYIELENYSYDNEFMINKKYINPLYGLDSKMISLNFDNQILDILQDKQCAWLFLKDTILLCLPEDKSMCMDFSAAVEISNAIDILNKLK